VADPRSKFKFPFVRYDEIKLKLDNQYLIKGLLPAQGLAPVYGAPSSGKSFLTLHAALHIAAGLEYAGRKVRKGRVVYIAAEGQGAFQNRVYAARKALGVQAEDFILIEVAPNLGVQGGDTDILTKNISAQLRPGEKPPDLIVIDTISQTLFGQDENREGLAMFVVNCALIRNELGGLILPVHHVGKDEGRGMRGWSGLHGAVGGVRSIPSVDQAIADEDLFLRLLDQVTEQGRHVSANPSSTYAPTVFAKLQDANGVAKHRFERAMNNLLKTSRIRVEEDGPPSKKRSFLARFL
jgi:RecA-family ATPase